VVKSRLEEMERKSNELREYIPLGMIRHPCDPLAAGSV
jgi:hypothetical protein